MRTKKRLLSILLTLALALGLMAGMSVTAVADGEKTITGLGTGAIGNPDKPVDGNSKWSGSYVYYGKYNSNSVKYRVLSKKTTAFGGNTIFLDCDCILIQKRFDDNSNQWGNSELHEWLNGNEFLGSTSVFSTVENQAIANSSVAAHEFAGYVTEPARGWFGRNDGNKKYYTALDRDKIFLLDLEDVLNKDYGYSADHGWDVNGQNWHAVSNHIKSVAGSATGSWWWLRSPYSSNDYFAGCVYGDGYVDRYYVAFTGGGVSPAFNVNLSSVIFSSLISGNAGSANAEYKLTLKDTTALSASLGTITRKGKTVTVPYSGVKGSPTQLSVVMTNGTWSDSGWSEGAEKKYYGKLNIKGSIGTSGTGTFDLPEGFSLSNGWKAYLVAEKVNGEKETDYASIPVAFTIPKLDPVCNAPTGVTATYGQKLADVTLTNPEGNTPGTWAWADSTQSVGDVVSPAATFKANFTPTDTANYNTINNVDVAVTVGKADSAVTKAPEAKTLTYTGSAQALVTAGTAEGGTMQYALGENATTAPADDLYTTTIPTATDAGT